MEMNTPQISESLKTEISFLVFKLSCLSQFMSDLNKFGLKIKLKFVINQTFRLFWGHPVL